MNHTVFSFNAGEVTPYLRHRIDFDKTESSAETMRNFIPNVYGGATKRPGLVPVSTLTTCTFNSRALPFVASTGAKFILHFTPGFLSIYNSAGEILSRLAFMVGYTFPAIDNFDDSLRQLQLVQLNDIAYIVHPRTHPLKLTYYGDSSWFLEFVDFSRAPMSNSNLDQTRRLTIASNPVAPGWNQNANYVAGDKVFTTSEWVCVVSHNNAAANTQPGVGSLWTTYWRRNFYRAGEAVTLLGTNLSEIGWAKLYTPYAVGDFVTTGTQFFVSTTHTSVLVRRWLELDFTNPLSVNGATYQWAYTHNAYNTPVADQTPGPNSAAWTTVGTNDYTGSNGTGKKFIMIELYVNIGGPGANGSMTAGTSRTIILPAITRSIHIRWRRSGDTFADAPVQFNAITASTPEQRITLTCLSSGVDVASEVIYDFPDTQQTAEWGNVSPGSWVDSVPQLVSGVGSNGLWSYMGQASRPLTWKCIQAIGNFDEQPPTMSGNDPATNGYWRKVDLWFYRGLQKTYAVNDLIMGSGTIAGQNPQVFKCLVAHTIALTASAGVLQASTTCPFANVIANGVGYTQGGVFATYWQAETPVSANPGFYGFLNIKNWTSTIPYGVGRRIAYNNQIWYSTATHFPTAANAPGQPSAPWSLQPTAGLQSNFIGDGTSPGLYYKLSPKRDSSDFQITLAATQANDNLYSTPIAVQGEWFIYTYGTWTGTFQIEASDNNGQTWEVIRSFQANADRNVSDGGTSTYPVLLRLRWFWGANGSSNPRAVLIPSNDGITGYALMDTYVGTSAMTGIAKTTMVSGATSDWSEGAFTRAKGFPKAIALHESRLVFGGTTTNPVSLWLSRTNDYTNFETGVLDDNAIFATLSISNSSPITWIGAQRRLFVGTKYAEWQVGSESQDAPITPLNFVARQYSSYGSSPFQPLTAGDAFLFFEKNGAKIRDFSFDNNSQGYSGADICRLAEHLFQVGASNMAWQQNREPGLWVVRRDGILLHMIYAKTDKVMAWSRHDTFNANGAGAFVNQGLFLDVVVFPGNGTDDDVYFVVRRTIGSTVTTRLERFQADWQRLMETGGGTLTDGTEAVVVRAELKSLPIDAQSRDGSTSLAYRKRVHKASISLIQSQGGFLWNSNIANKQAITGTTLTNGWVDVVPDGGSLDDLQLNIEHSTAQPFLLRAAVIRYKTNER